MYSFVILKRWREITKTCPSHFCFTPFKSRPFGPSHFSTSALWLQTQFSVCFLSKNCINKSRMDNLLFLGVSKKHTITFSNLLSTLWEPELYSILAMLAFMPIECYPLDVSVRFFRQNRPQALRTKMLFFQNVKDWTKSFQI